MPWLLAPPRPAKKLSGMLMTSAHGQLITRNVQALSSQSRHKARSEPAPAIVRISGGSSASASAAQHTKGV